MALGKAIKFIRVRGRIVPISLKSGSKMNKAGTVAGMAIGGASSAKNQSESKKGGIASKVFSVLGGAVFGGLVGGAAGSFASKGFNRARILSKGSKKGPELLRRTRNFQKVARFNKGQARIKDLKDMLSKDIG